MKNQFSQNKGFTLIELLVAMSLFVVVVALASNIFIQALRTQRATVALIAANNNASLAMEQMMREIRTGTNFDAGNGAGQDGEGSDIAFFSARENGTVTYSWNQTDKSIERDGPKAFIPPAITAKNVAVENLQFKLIAGPPPRITIILQISALGTTIKEPFINLQTTVSARLYQ